MPSQEPSDQSYEKRWSHHFISLIELLSMSIIKATFLSILSAQILKIVKQVFWGHFCQYFLKLTCFWPWQQGQKWPFFALFRVIFSPVHNQVQKWAIFGPLQVSGCQKRQQPWYTLPWLRHFTCKFVWRTQWPHSLSKWQISVIQGIPSGSGLGWERGRN